jgi:type IV secretory pathway VirB4 component
MPSNNNITATTQEHLDIEEIRDNVVVLKSGSVCAVLETTAVNFDLLSEIEQDALIAAFSMLLNSISFPLQIVIRSKKMDITKYIEKVQRVEDNLTDPLLKKQASAYKKFVQETIKKNDVLDKKFYVVIPSGGTAEMSTNADNPFLFLGKLFGAQNKRINVNVDEAIKKAKTELGPKSDHVMAEFNKINVKTKQLTTQELVELYFDIYNPASTHGQRIRTDVEDYKAAIVEPVIFEE